MTIEFITRNWALVIAAVLGAGILLFVLYRLYRASVRGRLSSNVRALKSRCVAATRAQRRLDKASTRLEKLRSKVQSVPPRLVEEAAEALKDARSLCKITADQVLIARNHVRIVILEEFSPKRQDGLRSKFLNGES